MLSCLCFFKQKTAYEMRISDWSSDVCSSDLGAATGLPGEPTPQDAVAGIGDYYAAIDAGSYVRAYALWSDGGRASKQTPQQFADGFADTAQVVATLGEPGRVDPGAGQRYIQIPVGITATTS